MAYDNLSYSELIHRKEKTYFTLALLTSVIVYLSLLVSVVGILFLTGGLLFSTFVHAIMMGAIRSNGVKLSPQQFSKVYEKVEELCSKMGIQKIPEVYVLESSGFLNAFATRFFGRNMVILYSSIFELIESGAEEELNFIIAHELAHIKRNHIIKQFLILPAMWIPFIGEAYSRSCEYTCDRIAAYHTENSKAAMNSLTILAIGKVLYKNVNRAEYLNQINSEYGFFVWLSEKLSTHPTLPKRIQEIMLLLDDEPSELTPYRRPMRTTLTWLFVAVVSLSAVSYIGVNGYQALESGILSELPMEAELTPLMMATTEGNLDQVRELLLKQGVDPNFQDVDGWSALYYASQDNQIEIGRELINAGADPNLATEYGYTVLMNAASYGNVEFIQFLKEFDVNIDQKDSDGMTALMYAADSNEIGALNALLDAGANPALEDNSHMTALEHAKSQDYSRVIDLLSKEK